MAYWLFKSEPTTFSIDDLRLAPQQTTFWDGVRNYQARNRLRDEIKVGDHVFIYHSSCAEPGISGLAEVIKAGTPDLSALDPLDHHYDPKSTVDNPIWYGVEIRFLQKFNQLLSISALRAEKALANMEVLRKGNRLSITMVSIAEAKHILKLINE